jgi:hypothetical protein
VDSDSHDVSGRDGGGVERIEGFVDDRRNAEPLGGRRREHVEPAGDDDPDSERVVVRVDEMNRHGIWAFRGDEGDAGSSVGARIVEAFPGVNELIPRLSIRALVVRLNFERGRNPGR